MRPSPTPCCDFSHIFITFGSSTKRLTCLLLVHPVHLLNALYHHCNVQDTRRAQSNVDVSLSLCLLLSDWQRQMRVGRRRLVNPCVYIDTYRKYLNRSRASNTSRVSRFTYYWFNCVISSTIDMTSCTKKRRDYNINIFWDCPHPF